MRMQSKAFEGTPQKDDWMRYVSASCEENQLNVIEAIIVRLSLMPSQQDVGN